VKRADKRTPEQVSVQRLTNLIDLPDADLCQVDHRTALLSTPHPPCGQHEIRESGAVLTTWVCELPGRWGYQVPGIGTRRGCDRHAAAACRARLYLTRQNLRRGHAT
jgi:hypothetical protein